MPRRRARSFNRRGARRKRNYTWIGVLQLGYTALTTTVNAITLVPDGMANALVEDIRVLRIVGTIGWRYQNSGGLGFFAAGIQIARHNAAGTAQVFNPFSADVDTYALPYLWHWQGEIPPGGGFPDSLDNITAGSESLLLAATPIDLKINRRLDKDMSILLGHQAAANGDMQIHVNLRTLVENIG